MSEVKQVIFDLLNQDVLRIRLAKNPIDNSLALYEIFAPPSAPLPYVVYYVEEINSDTHFGRNNGSVSFEIYTQDSTTIANEIKEAIIGILDQQRTPINGDDNHLYFDYTRDNLAFSAEEDVIHDHVEFSFFYWRNTFISFLDNQPNTK